MAKLLRTNEKSGKFAKGANAGTFTCTMCGTRRQLANREIQTEANGGGVCTDCYDVAGEENAHEDGYHADQPSASCPDCQTEAKQAEDMAAKQAVLAAKAPERKLTTIAVITILEVDLEAYRAEYGSTATIAELRQEVKEAVYGAGVTAAFAGHVNDAIIVNAKLKNR